MRKFDQPLPADIKTRLNQAQVLLAENPNIVFAYLFGGLARGEPKPLSDVDIAVYLDDENKNTADFKLALIAALTRELNTDELDLVILNTVPLSLAGRIQESMQVLVDKDPPRRYDYESLLRRQFADFKIRESALLRRRFGLDG